MQTTRHTALFTHPQTTDHSLPPTDNGSFSTLPQITPITLINSAALRGETAHRALNLKRVADALPAAQQLYTAALLLTFVREPRRCGPSFL